MTSIITYFEGRRQEIDVYIDLLAALERQVREGPPQIGGAPITAQQQRILYSSVYLQLYNLVEATVTWCVEAVAAAASDNGRWNPGDLSAELRREWIRFKARTHIDLNYDNRLHCAVEFCDFLIGSFPVQKWAVELGNSGNWSDGEIERITERIGCSLTISTAAKTGVKRHVRDDMGTLVLIKTLRNKLGHGALSFEECGNGVTVDELKVIKDAAVTYLREVVAAFERYIATYQFLIPTRRPMGSS
jgi:hypothetical protein